MTTEIIGLMRTMSVVSADGLIYTSLKWGDIVAQCIPRSWEVSDGHAGDDVFTKQEPDASHHINETLHRNFCLTLCRSILYCCYPCWTRSLSMQSSVIIQIGSQNIQCSS